MNPAIRGIARSGRAAIRSACLVVYACIGATSTPAGIAVAEPSQGSVVGWGCQTVGVDLSVGFVAIAAGERHGLGLKADGSIVAWGGN